MSRSGYEIVYIVDAETADVSLVQKKINSLLAQEEIEHKSLGVKKFAYPIKKKTSGHYFLVKTQQDAPQIKNFATEARWIPEILRFLVVSLAKEKHFRFSKARSKYLEKKQLWAKRNFDTSLIATPDKISSVSIDEKTTTKSKSLNKEDSKNNDPATK